MGFLTSDTSLTRTGNVPLGVLAHGHILYVSQVYNVYVTTSVEGYVYD